MKIIDLKIFDISNNENKKSFTRNNYVGMVIDTTLDSDAKAPELIDAREVGIISFFNPKLLQKADYDDSLHIKKLVGQ